MYIKKMHNKYRGDFIATYKCEFCGFTKTDKGVDSVQFYREAIPQMKCPLCSKRSIKPVKQLAV